MYSNVTVHEMFILALEKLYIWGKTIMTFTVRTVINTGRTLNFTVRTEKNSVRTVPLLLTHFVHDNH